MAVHIRPLNRAKCSGFQAFHDVTHRAADADGDLDVRRVEGLVGIGSAVTGEDHLHIMLSHQLCSLYSGTAAQGDVRVLNGFSAERFGVHDHEVRAPAEARINLILKRGSFGCYSNFHLWASWLISVIGFGSFRQRIALRVS